MRIRSLLTAVVTLLVIAGGLYYFYGYRHRDISADFDTAKEYTEDAATTSALKGALALNKQLSSLDIHVDSTNNPGKSGNDVTLTGQVPTEDDKRVAANITIKNFGQMDNHFYRGAQPKEEEYKELAQLGVKTIIDLRDDPLPYANNAVGAAGMRYFNIPMSDKDYPKDESIEEFLSITKEEGNWPFYVHCAGGRHRTGVMGAMYRFNHDEWNYDRAYEEMKNYDFYTRFGHGALKKYVEDYWRRLQTKGPQPSSAPLSRGKLWFGF
jgi:protein tyrosine phosphatase (PTP) superfamily phosphohydrolase (DUF442 family)